jgi:hypothetical protein
MNEVIEKLKLEIEAAKARIARYQEKLDQPDYSVTTKTVQRWRREVDKAESAIHMAEIKIRQEHKRMVLAEASEDPADLVDCEGYRSLREAVEESVNRGHRSRQELEQKFRWVVRHAHHYEQKTGVPATEILDAWEEKRDYWFLNYYQEANQPVILGDGSVRVFDTKDDALASIVSPQFRCPMCGGVSTNAYVCNSGKEMSAGKICDWKVYGLMGHLGKGVFVFIKSMVKGDNIFMPIAWEEKRYIIRFPAHAYEPGTDHIASVNRDGKDGWIAWGPLPTTDEISARFYPDGGGFLCPYAREGRVVTTLRDEKAGIDSNDEMYEANTWLWVVKDG